MNMSIAYGYLLKSVGESESCQCLELLVKVVLTENQRTLCTTLVALRGAGEGGRALEARAGGPRAARCRPVSLHPALPYLYLYLPSPSPSPYPCLSLSFPFPFPSLLFLPMRTRTYTYLDTCVPRRTYPYLCVPAYLHIYLPTYVHTYVHTYCHGKLPI